MWNGDSSVSYIFEWVLKSFILFTPKDETLGSLKQCRNAGKKAVDEIQLKLQTANL